MDTKKQFFLCKMTFVFENSGQKLPNGTSRSGHIWQMLRFQLRCGTAYGKQYRTSIPFRVGTLNLQHTWMMTPDRIKETMVRVKKEAENSNYIPIEWLRTWKGIRGKTYISSRKTS